MTLTTTIEPIADRVALSVSNAGGGLFRRRAERVAHANWNEHGFPASAVGKAALGRLARNGDATPMPDGRLRVTHAGLASLDAAEAAALGLPEPASHILEIATHDQIASDGFRAWTRFLRPDGHPTHAVREGALLREGERIYRLPASLYEVAEGVDAIAAAGKRDERIAAVARVRALLPDDAGGRSASGQARPDAFLAGLRVRHTHTFTLDVERENGDLAIDPVPLAAWTNEGEEGPPPLLGPDELAAFQVDFRTRGPAAAHVLARGTYLFVDPALRPAMAVVAERQRGPVAARLAFAQHPERELERAIGEAAFVADEGDEPRPVFGGGEVYSERVVEIGEWVEPDLPFIKRAPSTWLPERFCVILGGKVVSLGPDDVGAAIDDVEVAIARGETTAVVGGVEVLATSETMKTLGGLRPPEKPTEDPNGEQGQDEGPTETPSPPPKLVALTKTNHHVADFERTLAPRKPCDAEPDMRSTLREHQHVALDWMRSCWRAGRPGVLLADDMGLGKTIEVLSFLSSLREAGERRPFLIVAPTSLLTNWTREHDTHLERGLGLRVTAYAGGLKALRTDTGREWELGRAVLDRGTLGLPDMAESPDEPVFVLTTYETLRDYQFSFASIPFAVAVYDETQKVKNPKSRATAAAKSVNADLSIAMTGTPVENAMADLWSICDLVSPGMLPPLRDFHRECSAENTENLEALRDALLEARPDGTPPFALRRLKSDVVALPPLHEVTLPRTMEGH